MILGCLLGNTSLQFCTFDPRDDARPLEHVGRLAWRELDDHGEQLAALSAAPGLEAIVVGSVRDDLLPRLEARLSSAPRWLVVGRDFQLSIENRYERPEQVGIDRLLNALAASYRANGRGAIVVDFGTTISMTVVSPDGAFLGGAIASGLSCAAAGLAASAPALPPVRLYERPPFLGRTTEAGLQAGVYWQTVGGVSRILSGLAIELADSPLIYATGGDAPLFVPAMEEIYETVPELTLEGLRIAYGGAAGANRV